MPRLGSRECGIHFSLRERTLSVAGDKNETQIFEEQGNGPKRFELLTPKIRDLATRRVTKRRRIYCPNMFPSRTEQLCPPMSRDVTACKRVVMPRETMGVLPSLP